MLPSHSQHERTQAEIKKLTIDFEPGFSLRDALNVLFCHKWKIILFFCTVVSAISVSTYRMPDFYSSEAKILIGVGRDPNTIAPILNPSQYLNQNQQERVNNEVIILKSRLLAERVVDKVGYENFFKKRKLTEKKTTESDKKNTEKTPPSQPNESPTEKNTPNNAQQPSNESKLKIDKELWNIAVNQVAGGLTVELKPLSFIVGLTTTLRDPALAQKVLKTLIDEYIKRYLELSEAKSVNVFQARYEQYAADYNKKEENLNKFKIENNIISLDEQKTILISRSSELMGQINATETRIAGLKAKIADLLEILPQHEKIIITQTTEGKTNYVADALKNLLTKLRTQEIELMSRYPDDSRKVTDIKQQITLVENSLSEEPESNSEYTKSLNQTYEHFSRQLEENKIELNSQLATLKSINTQFTETQKQLEQLASHEFTLGRLEREREIAAKEYQAQLAIVQKADSYKALNESKIVNVDIIEPPTFSDEAVKPDKPKNVILAIVLGLLGGIGLAFFLDYFDDSMKTNEDVKRHLKLPVLAMITTNEFERLCKG